MSDNDRTQVNFNADVEDYELAKEKADHGELSEKLRGAIKEIAYGERVTERERKREQLREYREEKREIEQKINNLQRDRDEIERKIDRVESRLSELEDQDGKYDGMLEAIESQIRDGVRVTEGAPAVQDAAEASGGTPAEVIQDLQERNLDLPDAAFRESKPSEPPRWNQ